MSSFLHSIWWKRCLGMTLASLLAGCGGGGSSGSRNDPPVSTPTLSGPNVQAVRVSSGPAGLSVRVANLLYTSVKVCEPGTSNCQVIDHVLVDTGSTGLRLLHSAVNLSLPQVQAEGKPLYNCVQFIDQSYMWGPVVSADVSMGGSQLDGQQATQLRIQLAGATGSPAAPADCAQEGLTANNSINDLGANGILGVGTDRQDCGSLCEDVTNNGYYHADHGGGALMGIAVPRTDQIQQPVSQFSPHNNGVIIQLPTVASSGSPSATGNMIFGIGTADNNQPTSTSVMAPNLWGYFTTEFDGRVLTKGFVDSGSNGWFFGTTASPAYRLCTNAPQWYCPTSAQTAQATNSSVNGQTSSVNVTVANARDLFNNSAAYAYSNLAGPVGDPAAFDFGLPFFFGRSVVTALDEANTPLGQGPYVAY